jgi:hypothetical protein
MKRRKGYRRKQGHRQGFTDVRIVDIDLGSPKSGATPARGRKAAPAVKHEAKAEKPVARKAVAPPEPQKDKGAEAADWSPIPPELSRKRLGSTCRTWWEPARTAGSSRATCRRPSKRGARRRYGT